MSLQTRLAALITAIGADIKQLKQGVQTAATAWVEPTYASGWNTLNYTTPDDAYLVRARKRVDGTVEFRGIVWRTGGAFSVPINLFTLPQNLWPLKNEYAWVGGQDSAANKTMYRMVISPVGVVSIDQAQGASNGGSGTYIYLDQVEFPSASGSDVLTLTTNVPTLVATLPTNPVDKQEVYFQTAAMRAKGVGPWHLRADTGAIAGGSPYRWKVVGAVQLHDYTNVSYTQIPSTGYTTVASITIPTYGKYDVEGSLGLAAVTGVTADTFCLAINGVLWGNALTSDCPYLVDRFINGEIELQKNDVLQLRVRVDIVHASARYSAPNLVARPKNLDSDVMLTGL